MYDRSQLIRLFHERALKFGDFTLASGKKSTYYLDGKQISLHSTGLRQVSLGCSRCCTMFRLMRSAG